MNNSSSNIFKILLLLERYHHNCQAVLAATGMNSLKQKICFLFRDSPYPFQTFNKNGKIRPPVFIVSIVFS